MRVYLDQIGCRLNYSEMETLAGQLRNAGHQIAASAEEAQVVVFNSCAVTAGAERDSRKRLASLQRSNPTARIAATGCWATLRPEQAAQQPGVALVVPNPRKELLAVLLEPWSAELDDFEQLLQMEPEGIPLSSETERPRSALASLSKSKMAVTTAAPFALSQPCAGKAAACRWPASWPRCRPQPISAYKKPC